MSTREKAYEIAFSVLTVVGIAGSIISVLIGIYFVFAVIALDDKPSETAILSSVLSVMLFIAISNLDRYRKLRRIDTQSEKTRELIEDKIVKQIKASAFFNEDAVPNSGALASASQIWISGITLGNTAKAFVHDLSQRLEAGADVRFILLDTEEDTLEQLVRRSFGNQADTKYYRERIEATRTLIRIIAETPDSTGTIAVGAISYVPSFGIVLIDPESANGKGYVEVYHHNSQRPSPRFRLDVDSDPQWFYFFKEQYELMWNRSTITNLPSEVQHGRNPSDIPEAT